MKKWNILNGSLLAILGLLVVIFPKFWIKLIVIVLGMGAIVYGIYNFKITRALYDDTSYRRTIIIRGIISILIGVCAILFPLVFHEVILKIMIWILVGYFIVSAVLGFYASALLRNSGINRKKYIFENIALLLVAVVLILISPTIEDGIIIRIIGIAIIIIGVAIIIYGIIFRKKEDDIVASYEVKDEPISKDDDKEKAEDAVVVDSEKKSDEKDSDDDKSEKNSD